MRYLKHVEQLKCFFSQKGATNDNIMDRKNFIKKGLVGIGALTTIPTFLTSCSKEEINASDLFDSSESSNASATDSSDSCTISPSETEGPYPIKTPAQYVRENIVSDRTGVAMLMIINVQDASNGCIPLEGVLVDVWHCDKDGNYSQYNNYTSANFLRGRQTTDGNGQVSFISIFPGWYRGRAPHIHIEISDTNGSSLLVSQIAFPKDIYTEVYNSSGYNGAPDTSNEQDNIFSDSLSQNMADDVSGNITDGYTLAKTIVV